MPRFLCLKQCDRQVPHAAHIVVAVVHARRCIGWHVRAVDIPILGNDGSSCKLSNRCWTFVRRSVPPPKGRVIVYEPFRHWWVKVSIHVSQLQTQIMQSNFAVGNVVSKCRCHVVARPHVGICICQNVRITRRGDDAIFHGPHGLSLNDHAHTKHGVFVASNNVESQAMLQVVWCRWGRRRR